MKWFKKKNKGWNFRTWVIILLILILTSTLLNGFFQFRAMQKMNAGVDFLYHGIMHILHEIRTPDGWFKRI